MLEGCTPYPEDFVRKYVSEGYWQAETLGDFLQNAARRYGPHPIVLDGACRVSYAEMEQLSTRLALHFLDRGFKPRDIVLMQLPNIWQYIPIFFALQKIGVLPVTCLPQHRHTELSFFAKLTNAVGYFIAPEFRGFNYLPLARELQRDVPSLQHVVAVGDGSEPGVSYLEPWLGDPIETKYPPDYLARYRPDPFDVALFLLSGGTTGIPKLIPRTHSDYLYNARQSAQKMNWDSSVVFLVVIPSVHNFPLSSPGLLGAVSVGAKVAVCSSTDPEQIFQATQQQKGTDIALSPALLITMLNSPHLGKYDLSSLRRVMAGGQRMQPELADRTWSTLGGATPVQVFGMAEGLINMTLPDDPKEVIRHTQGRPISPADEIRLVDDDGKEVPPGEVGELLTRGPYTIRGYYKAAEHNRTAFTPDGFYRSGDMVCLHPSGNLVVEGRKKDMINRGGEKISAEEVESLMLTHESVLNVAVVAMPDPVMGEKSCAFVIPRAGRTMSMEEMTKFLLDKRIAKFKLPERLELVASFPTTDVGKVSKKDLRQIIADKLRAEGKLPA